MATPEASELAGSIHSSSGNLVPSCCCMPSPMLTNTSLPANGHRPLLGHMLNGAGPVGSQACVQGILSP